MGYANASSKGGSAGAGSSSGGSRRVYTNSLINSTVFRKDNENNPDYYDIDEITQNEAEEHNKFLFDQSMLKLVDFDGDGDVDNDDVTLFKNKIENGEINNAEPNLTTFKADLTGDGVVDEKDILIMENYVEGNDISNFIDSNYIQEKGDLVGSDFAKENDLKAFYKKNAGSHEKELEKYTDLLLNELGDVNGDHKLDNSDIDYLKEYMSRSDYNQDSLNLRDLNGDGTFNDVDLQIMSDYVGGKDVSSSLDQLKLLDIAYDKNIRDYKQQISYYESYKSYLEQNGESDEQIALVAEKIVELNANIRNTSFAKTEISEYEKFNGLKISDYDSDKSSYWQKNVDYEKVYQAYKDGTLNDVTTFLTDEAIENQDYDVDYLAIIEYLAKEKLVDYTELKNVFPEACLLYDKLDESQIKKFHETYEEEGADAARNYAYSLADEVGLYDDSAPPDTSYENAGLLSDDQKKYFQYLYDTHGKDVAEKYLQNANIYSGFVSKINENSVSSLNAKSDNDYLNGFVNEKYDIDGNGQFDVSDITAIQSKLKNKDDISEIVDISGDGVFNETDLKLLQRHLNGEDISAAAGSFEAVSYVYESKLNDYTSKRDALMDYSDNIKNIYNSLPDEDTTGNPSGAVMTKADADRLLFETSSQIAMMNQLIVSQKKANKLLPYINKSCSDEYREYVQNYHPDWQPEVDYEKLYDIYINNSHQLPNTSGLGIKDELLENARLNDPEEYQRLLNLHIDWVAVADYFINVKGENMDSLPDTLWTGIDDSYKKYKFMTDEQQYMYHYLFQTEGYDAANEYAENAIGDELMQKEAKERVTKYIETLNPTYEYDENGNIISVTVDDNAMNAIRQFLKGFDKGMTDYYSGMLKWGEDGYTMDEYEQMYMMKFLSDNDLLMNAFNAGETVGNVETNIAITTFLTIACPEGTAGYASLALNNTVGTLNAGGSAQHSALVEGYDLNTANEYARQMMKNTLITNLSSSTIGLGITSTFQYTTLFSGVNSLGVYDNILISLSNGVAGLESAKLQARGADDISEAILNKKFTVDERNQHEAEAFLNAMLASAVSSAHTISFELILGGEPFSFSSDDWLDYLKSTDKPTAEDFINSYCGSYAIDPDTGKTVHIYYEDGVKKAAYIDGPDELGNHILGIMEKNSSNVLNSKEKENLNYLLGTASDDTIEYIFDHSSNESLQKLINNIDDSNLSKENINSIKTISNKFLSSYSKNPSNYIGIDSNTVLKCKKLQLLTDALDNTDLSKSNSIVSNINEIEKQLRTKIPDELAYEYALQQEKKKNANPSSVKGEWNDWINEFHASEDEINAVLIDRMEAIRKKLDWCLKDGHAYDDPAVFYQDLATGANNHLSQEYITARSNSYSNGSSRDGYMSFNSTYSNSAINFVATGTDGSSLDAIAANLKVGGPAVEIDISGDRKGSIGRAGQTQYVSSSDQYNSVASSVYNSTKSNDASTGYGERYVDHVSKVNGLPSDSADRVVELQFERPSSELQFSHNDSAGANSQALTGGLPVQELPDGTYVSMYEGLVPSIDLKTADINDLNLTYTVRDINTGTITAKCRIYRGADGKVYTQRIA